MMKKLLFMTGVILTLNAQAQEFEWVSTIKGVELAYIRGTATDAEGNIYAMGQFEGTVDFDPSDAMFNMTSAGGVDAFVQKLNSDGELIWAVSFGGEDDDIPSGIAVDGSGNCYTTGSFRGTTDLDPSVATLNATSSGSRDVFVQKLNSEGELIWAHGYGGSADVYGVSIATDTDGNCYTTGIFIGGIDIDPDDTDEYFISTGMIGTFFQKLNGTGDFEWGGQFETSISSVVNATEIAVDASNNVIVCGNFSGTIDFDPSADTEYNITFAGNDDGFVTKLDADGDFQWTVPYQSTSHDYVASTKADPSGNIYVVGGFQGTTDFDPLGDGYDLSSSGSYDIFTQKLSADGIMVWTNSHGDANQDAARHIAIDNESNCYIIGSYDGTVDFDPSGGVENLTESGDFIQKLDTEGHLIWVSRAHGFRISTDSESNCYTSGFYGDFDGTLTVDFDPSDGTVEHTTIETYDGFIVKFGPDCNIDTGVSQSGITLFADQDGAIYQWVDCDDDYSPILGETDQSFTPDADGNFAVEITLGDCVDLSSCTSIENVGINSDAFNTSIYPNPTKGLVNIVSNSPYTLIGLYDLSGSLIGEFNGTEIDLSNVPNGMYLLQINTENGTTYRKLIKQ